MAAYIRNKGTSKEMLEHSMNHLKMEDETFWVKTTRYEGDSIAGGGDTHMSHAYICRMLGDQCSGTIRVADRQ